MKTAQKTITFKKQFRESYDLSVMPTAHFDWEHYVRDLLMRKGYLIRSLKATPTITITCYIARANFPRIEREKMQKEIDEMPENLNISKPYRSK